jgi:subtilase family serine protease
MRTPRDLVPVIGTVLAFGLVSIWTLAIATSAHAQNAASGTTAIHGGRAEIEHNFTSRLAANRMLKIKVNFAIRDRAQLDKLLAAQADPKSTHYHKWLTSSEFDARFGRTAAEVADVADWLSSSGFVVTNSSGRGINAAAPVSAVESALSTTIAASSDGVVFANTDDPQIPARFEAVIGSIEGLDNTSHSRAGYTGGGTTGFAPADVRSFYNENPLLNGGFTGTGTDCIALIEDSDYADYAIAPWDTTFSLPVPNLTRVLADGTNPGLNGDENESELDVEWAHAMAPSAPLRVYIGNNGAITEPLAPGIVDALTRAVSDNACSVISISYTLCGGSSSFYTSTLDSQFAQAAAQGQSVFVITGDWGAAGLVSNGTSCVLGTSPTASEMAADPNVTAVGGTQFNPVYDGWGNDVGSVPESAWPASGGGVSAYFSKPSYQIGVTPADGMRDIPDISLGASAQLPGFWYSGGAPICCSGGTSFSAPMWAGFARVIEQEAGARLGNLNPKIYQLAQMGAGSSGLRDVTSGNNGSDGVAGFNAVAGYDLVTGWGSVDVATFASAYMSSTSSEPLPTATATASATPTPHPTLTSTPTPTETLTPTPTPTGTLTPTPSPTKVPKQRGPGWKPHGNH